jgi:hypothetical protein
LQDIQNDITKLKHYAFYVYIRSRNKTTKKSVEAELRGIKPKRLKIKRNGNKLVYNQHCLIIAILLIIFFIKRNLKDEKDLEVFLDNNDLPIDKEEEELNNNR